MEKLKTRLGTFGMLGGVLIVLLCLAPALLAFAGLAGLSAYAGSLDTVSTPIVIVGVLVLFGLKMYRTRK